MNRQRSTFLPSSRLRLTVVAMALLLAAPLHGAVDQSLKPRKPHGKLSREAMQAQRHNDVARLKFVEGSHVRLRNGKLVAEVEKITGKELARLTRSGLSPSALHLEMARVNATLSRYGAVVSTRFTRSEAELTRSQEAGEARSKKELPDLTLHYNLRFARASVEEMIDALIALNALGIVEFARPALPVSSTGDDYPPTLSYVSQQTYLGSAPGLGVSSVWAAAGGRGLNMKISDVEYGWITYHEDLPSISVSGYNNAQNEFRDHSTAVRGILNGIDNAYGVTGIANQATVYGSSVGDYNGGQNDPANAIDAATGQVSEGDIILVEVATRCSVTPYLECPVEYDEGTFDAIVTATGDGYIVVEGAGNTDTDLDSIEVDDENIFDRGVRDSEAIIVGAGTNTTDHDKLSFSSHGDRVDVQGWGQGVVTTGGQGDLFFPSGDRTQAYTDSFSGTSSASAMIAGATAVINGVRKARALSLYDSAQMRTALLTGAASQGDPENGNIGPFPNVAAVVAAISLPAPVTTAEGTASSVTVTWPAVAGAADYRVYRADSGASPVSWILKTTSSSLTYTDSSVSSGATYMYAVRARDGAGNESAAPGIPDLATTIAFTDTVLGDPILATYITQVRSAANMLCTFAGATICSSAPYSSNDVNSTLVQGEAISASSFTGPWNFAAGIRTSVGAKSESRVASTPATDGAITKQHVYDLRKIVN